MKRCGGLQKPCVLVALQDQEDTSSGRFVQSPQLVWLAMNVLLALMKPVAMTALLQQAWPRLVDALLQESGRPSQHMWMVVGCLRTVYQVLGAQVSTVAEAVAVAVAVLTFAMTSVFYIDTCAQEMVTRSD